MNKQMMKHMSSAMISCMILMPAGVLHAAQSSQSHAVRVQIPQALSFTGDSSALTLSFSDVAKGSESDIKTITYSIKANNVARQNGVIQANLSGPLDNVDLMAKVGTYRKQAGNGQLIAEYDGFKTVGQAEVNLCNRKTDFGNGRVLMGQIPINYKAIATNDLERSPNTQTLHITLADI